MADPTIVVQPVENVVQVSANVIAPPAGPATLGAVVLTGDLGGTAYAPVVEKIQGTPIAPPPGGTALFLAGDGTWQSASSSGGVQIGGDLGGTNNSPTVIGVHFTVPLADGGTGATTQQGAINALTGAQAAGRYLRSDGANAALAAIAPGDVPTLNQSTTGTAAGLSATLAIGSGGTGQTSASAAYNALSPMTTLGDLEYESGANTAARLAGNTSATKNFLSQTGSGSASAAPAWGTIQAGDVPTLNQSTTGTAANITGVAAIANGGTGQSAQQAAITALTGSQSAGRYLRSDGTNAVLSAIQSADIPTLNQDTTGVASNVSGTVAILHGGTGQTTQQAAITALTGTQASGRYLRSDGANAALAAIQAVDVPTLNQNTTGTASNVTGTVAIASGGTGQSGASAAFNALSPVSALGDLIYGSGANANARLAGSSSATKQFLTQTGNGSISAAPAWDTLAAGDLPAGTVTTANAATTVQPGTSYGTASATGTATAYAREDHQHGTVSLASSAPATTLAIGTAAATGTGTTSARTDHVHPMAAAATPTTSAVGDAAATGNATTFAASNHTHGREAFGSTTATTSVYNVASTSGAAATLARSDHNHGLPDGYWWDSPSQRGFVEWNFPPMVPPTNNNLTSGVIYGTTIIAHTNSTITKVGVHVVSSASVPTSGQNLIAFYTISGTTATQAGITSDLGTWSSAGLETYSIGSQALTAGNSYLVLLMSNASTPVHLQGLNTTSPAFYNLGLNQATSGPWFKFFVQTASAATAMPPSFTIAAGTMSGTNALAPWITLL